MTTYSIEILSINMTLSHDPLDLLLNIRIAAPQISDTKQLKERKRASKEFHTGSHHNHPIGPNHIPRRL